MDRRATTRPCAVDDLPLQRAIAIARLDELLRLAIHAREAFSNPAKAPAATASVVPLKDRLQALAARVAHGRASVLSSRVALHRAVQRDEVRLLSRVELGLLPAQSALGRSHLI